MTSRDTAPTVRTPPHEVDAVLFDLDGTLIDTLDLILASMRHATATVLGAPLPDAMLMLNVGVPLWEQMREFDEASVDELVRVYREHNALVHDEMIREYPGVDETLKRLRMLGKRMGVVTSKAGALARRGIEHFGLTGYFEVIVSSDDVAVHKPDPFPLLFAAEGMGLAPERCAYVGDSPHDVTAAVGAGCTAVAALWGVASRERLLEAGPDFMVSSMAEVARLFEGALDEFRV